MKKGIIGLIMIGISLVMNISCVEPSEKSQYKEFDLNDSEGNTRKCGIYLPQGMKPNGKYPVIFMEDGLVFKETNFKHLVDSLVDYQIISPVIIVCSYENKITIPGYRIAYRNAEYVEAIAKSDQKLATLYDTHYTYFKQILIPYVNKHYPVSEKADDRIYFGTSNSADFGITFGMRDGGMFSEFWCYSPVYSDVTDYGQVQEPVNYYICWGNKEEIDNFDYFPSLLKDIRKRGGNVTSWIYDGGHDREWWKYWFGEEIVRRFPYKKN